MLYIIVSISLSLISGVASNARIIGGGNANIEDYPHQVSVQWLDMHICSGTIISETYIITAAHCLEYKHVGDVTIRAGTASFELGGTVIAAKAVYTHDQYQRDVNRDGISKYLFDIAIIELAQALAFDVPIAAVALADEGAKLQVDQDLSVVGWGARSEDNAEDYSKQLQMVVVVNIALDSCRAVYDPDDEDIVDSDLCAGVRGGGKGFCNGDDGSPLFQYGGAVRDRRLYGVASWQIGCGEARYPGIYTSIGDKKVRDFIKTTTNL